MPLATLSLSLFLPSSLPMPCCRTPDASLCFAPSLRCAAMALDTQESAAAATAATAAHYSVEAAMDTSSDRKKGTTSTGGSESAAKKAPTVRDHSKAPVVKLSVELIKTYKHINEVSLVFFVVCFGQLALRQPPWRPARRPTHSLSAYPSAATAARCRAGRRVRVLLWPVAERGRSVAWARKFLQFEMTRRPSSCAVASAEAAPPEAAVRETEGV